MSKATKKGAGQDLPAPGAEKARGAVKPGVQSRVCEIIAVDSKHICVDFDGYGVRVDCADPSAYANRTRLRVYYSGAIKAPDFKAWLQ